jgi:hypothetical protein
MATKYASLSGYHYSGNNPVMFNDPSGADPDVNATAQQFAEEAKRALAEAASFWSESSNKCSGWRECCVLEMSQGHSCPMTHTLNYKHGDRFEYCYLHFIIFSLH